MPEARMKLLFVCGSLAGGGAEKILAYLVNHLDPRRYDRRLVILERKLDYLSEIDPAVRLDCLDQTPRLGLFKVAYRLRGLLREYRPAVVISVLNYVNIVTMLAKLFSGVRTRVILCEHLHLHDYFPAGPFGRLKRTLMCRTFDHAEAIVAVSKSIKHNMETEYGLDPRRIHVIYNPIPIDEIVAKSRTAVDHPFFSPGRFKVIISAGRLVRQKRFDRMLRAFAQARAKRRDLRLIILGKGELERELKDLARELGIEQEIDLVGFQERPSAWMAKADMFAMSSEREGFPNVLIEAMACGVPIISTDCLSGPGEIIDPGRNGLLVPEEPPEALAEAFLKLADDDALRAQFSEAGKRFADQFRIEKVLPQYERLFSVAAPDGSQAGPLMGPGGAR